MATAGGGDGEAEAPQDLESMNELLAEMEDQGSPYGSQLSMKRSFSSSLHAPPESMLLFEGEDEDGDGDGDDDAEASAGTAPGPKVGAAEGDLQGMVGEDRTGTDETSPRSDGGVKIHAMIRPDNFSDARKAPGGTIKPCRPMPEIKVSDLLAGLRQEGDRWLFRGPLNGWPGLVDLELKSLTQKASGLSSLKVGIRRLWVAGTSAPLPDKAGIGKNSRATFVSPAWTMLGFTDGSPGFAWWFTPRVIQQQSPGAAPGLLCGEQMVTALETPGRPYALDTAVRCHAFAHRYPVEKETLRDRQTYHTGVLVEWEHGRFGTIVELAWIYGCSGYSGRSNWCEDRDETPTELFGAMPECMKRPWDTGRSEIRVYDVPMRNRAELDSYLTKYSTKGGLPKERHRFLEPVVYASSPVRLQRCTPSRLAGYLLNYIQNVGGYDQITANCQTFAANFYGFMAGDKETKPFGRFVQVKYVRHLSPFLYVYKYKP